MTILGEGFCQAVLEPYGPALKRRQTLAVAEEWFTKGLQYAQTANDANLRNLALLGRARVRLDLKNLDAAVADASRCQRVSTSTLPGAPAKGRTVSTRRRTGAGT